MWTTPKTDWQVNEIVDAADMNAIGENLAALKSPPSGNFTQSATDYTTTSTTFVDVDATNMAYTLTTGGGDMLIGFVLPVTNSVHVSHLLFDVTLDGVRLGASEGMIIQSITNSTSAELVCVAFLKTGVSAGSHTFKLQWRVTNGTGRIYSGSTVGGLTIAQFWVREVS